MPALNERIGEVVKRKRQRDRLTQADLGGRIGVSGSYIGGVEGGQTSPRIAEYRGLGHGFSYNSLRVDYRSRPARPQHLLTHQARA